MTKALLFLFTASIPLTDASRYYLGAGSVAEILLVVLSLAWLFQLPRIGFSLSAGLGLLFLVLVVIVTFSWEAALQRNLEFGFLLSGGSIIRYIEYFVTFFLISQLARTTQLRTAVIFGLVTGGVIELGVVFTHWLMGPEGEVFHQWGPRWAEYYTESTFRVWGSFGNPLSLVVFLSTFIGIVTVLAGSDARLGRRPVWAALLALTILAFLTTGSRSALLLLLLPLLYLAKNISVQRLMAGAIVASLVIFAVNATDVGTVMASRINLLGTENDSVLQRLSVYRSSIEMMNDYPLLGVGPENFESEYERAYIMAGASTAPSSFTSENMFLQYGAELGVPAMVLFATSVVLILSSSRRTVRNTRSTHQSRVIDAAGLGLACFIAVSLIQASSDAASNLLLMSLLGVLDSHRKLASDSGGIAARAIANTRSNYGK